MMKGESVLTGAQHPGTTLKVMSSPAGYYLGFADEHGAPYSRETHYFQKQALAELVLEQIRTGGHKT